MVWTAIVVSMKTGKVIDSFTFTGVHGGHAALEVAKIYVTGKYLDIAAVIPGDHPVYF
jgi:hypothetical protein